MVEKAVDHHLYQFAKVFVHHNYQLFLVGGAIRDILLHQAKEDWDFATDAEPQQVQKIFPKTIPTGIANGTITVRFQGRAYEVTTFRTEGHYVDKRRPSYVRYETTIEEDLLRRDFTINAFAFNLHTKELLGVSQGAEDLIQRIIRTVGNPLERFEEDALRMLRACRFVAQLDFGLAEQTYQALCKKAKNLTWVSRERVHTELDKLLLADQAARGVYYLHHSTLLRCIFPHYRFSPVYHSVLSSLPSVLGMRYAMFFWLHSRQRIGFYLKSLKSSVSLAKNVDAWHHFLRMPWSTWQTPPQVRVFLWKFFAKLAPTADYRQRTQTISYWLSAQEQLIKSLGTSAENLPLLSQLRDLRATIEQILLNQDPLSFQEIAINGWDLQKHFNLRPSAQVGKLLSLALQKVLHDPLNNNQAALLKIVAKYAKSYSSNPSSLRR